MGVQKRAYVQGGGAGYIDYNIDNATVAADGAMSSSDKQTLNNLASSAPAVPVTTLNIQDGVAKTILAVDMSKTIPPGGTTPDNSWACMIFYAVECTDGTNVQIRSGNAICNISRAQNGTYANSSAERDAAANTAGTLSVNFVWSTSGAIASLQMTANTSLVPTGYRITFYIPYVTHVGAVTVTTS